MFPPVPGARDTTGMGMQLSRTKLILLRKLPAATPHSITLSSEIAPYKKDVSLELPRAGFSAHGEKLP